MKRLLLGATLICSCVAPVVAQERLAVGTAIGLPAENDYYGCHDLENAKEATRIRVEGDASSSVGRAYGMGARAVAQFVREHNNVCAQLPTDANANWKVVGTYDWPSGGPQLVCLAPTKSDAGLQPGASPAPRDEPSCWWTDLNGRRSPVDEGWLISHIRKNLFAASLIIRKYVSLTLLGSSACVRSSQSVATMYLITSTLYGAGAILLPSRTFLRHFRIASRLRARRRSRRSSSPPDADDNFDRRGGGGASFALAIRGLALEALYRGSCSR